jgi:hypothetical protein
VDLDVRHLEKIFEWKFNLVDDFSLWIITPPDSIIVISELSEIVL